MNNLPEKMNEDTTVARFELINLNYGK